LLGPERVETGRINDPSRHHLAMSAVRSATNPETWEKAIEVRDKPVAMHDIQIFAKTAFKGMCGRLPLSCIGSAARLDEHVLTAWANEFG